MTQIPVALQLYTVRDDAAANLEDTLASVRSAGYTNVELAGLYGLSASKLRNLLDKNELKAISAHVGLQDLEAGNAGKTIESYLALDVYDFVVPYVGEDLRLGGSGYLAIADRLNSAGEMLATFGGRVGYHNHNFEFTETSDGLKGIEILLKQTDPSLVTFELDTYWALFAGTDPVQFIKAHATRLSLLHIKDLDPIDRSFAPVGTGTLPLDDIIKAAAAASVRYLIVEQDTTKGPALDAIKLSLDNLKAKGYA